MSAIYLIRHGQASFGAADYDQLSELGYHQAHVLGKALSGRRTRPERVVCGTMRRHAQTAEKCLLAMDLPIEWESDPDWNEYDHEDVLQVFEPRYRDPATITSDLAGSDNPRKKFQEIFSKATDRWVTGEHDSQYRESWGAFGSRVQRALAKVQRALGKSTNALVFTSGGPIASACAGPLNLRPADAIRLNSKLVNAAVTKLVYGGDAIHVSTINEHGHFEHDAALITYR